MKRPMMRVMYDAETGKLATVSFYPRFLRERPELKDPLFQEVADAMSTMKATGKIATPTAGCSEQVNPLQPPSGDMIVKPEIGQ